MRLAKLDDGYEGDRALVNTINLVKKEKVFALFGYVGTPTLVRSLPAIRKLHRDEGVFLFGNFTGAQPQRAEPYLGYVFNLRASYRQETEGLVNNLVKNGYKRIGLFIQFDSYGRSGADGVRRALERIGLSLVEETTYLRGAGIDQSMLEQANRLKSANVDAVISVASYEASAAFTRDMRGVGMGVPIANVSFVGIDQLYEKLKMLEIKHEVNLTKNVIASSVLPSWNNDELSFIRDYQVKMKNNNGNRNLNFISMEGYLYARMFVEVLKAIGENPTREKFLKEARRKSGFDIGLNEKLFFTNDDNQALNKVFYVSLEGDRPNEFSNWSFLRGRRLEN
jgi:ABC-type branched-subunit amino acid transport system substrate-binding protein